MAGTNIAQKIANIQADRNTIRAKLVEMGLAESTANLNALATAIAGIINRGAVSATVQEGDTYTIPPGFHNGSGTVSGVSGGGNYNLQSKEVTPTKAQQNVTPDNGYFGLSDVTVKAIPSIYHDVSGVTAAPEDVLAGKLIVDSTGQLKAGTMQDNGAVDKTLDIGTPSYTVHSGRHNGLGVVKIVPETKNVTPSKTTQNITPAAGKVLQKVTVAAIPANFVDTTEGDAVAPDIRNGKIVFVDGVKVVGSMPDNGSSDKTIDGMTVTSVTIPEGYTSGGTVSLTGAIEAALAAI